MSSASQPHTRETVAAERCAGRPPGCCCHHTGGICSVGGHNRWGNCDGWASCCASHAALLQGGGAQCPPPLALTVLQLVPRCAKYATPEWARLLGGVLMRPRWHTSLFDSIGKCPQILFRSGRSCRQSFQARAHPRASACCQCCGRCCACANAACCGRVYGTVAPPPWQACWHMPPCVGRSVCIVRRISEHLAGGPSCQRWCWVLSSRAECFVWCF
jgi:hypothetical protein